MPVDYRKTKAPVTTVTQDIEKIEAITGNIYESVVIIAKRANQIAIDLKQELNKKLEEFANYTDNLEEVFENREQIEISRFYERLPKPTLIALQEFKDGEIYFRRVNKEENNKES
ncbi:MAG TPA: DNA-directed RNA polymerase subunit omega [Bacteroidales bacterium]|nr:DNA-directed RNA polymerase subunit omega [Bacteroidales bacterium]HOK99313.1 DNA-directed RNA polymerase subunit omega [Bacteroidales bacterium]HPO66374.1 DNA-directed RNA polymerase subunit omega [Bacteroidales bacterium]